MRRSTALFVFFMAAAGVHLATLWSRTAEARHAASDLGAVPGPSPERIVDGYAAVLVLLAILVPLAASLLPGSPAARLGLLDRGSKPSPERLAKVRRVVRDTLLVSGAAMAFFFSVLVELQIRALSRGGTVEGWPGDAVVQIAALAFAALAAFLLRPAGRDPRR